MSLCVSALSTLSHRVCTKTLLTCLSLSLSVCFISFPSAGALVASAGPLLLLMIRTEVCCRSTVPAGHGHVVDASSVCTHRPFLCTPPLSLRLRPLFNSAAARSLVLSPSHPLVRFTRFCRSASGPRVLLLIRSATSSTCASTAVTQRAGRTACRVSAHGKREVFHTTKAAHPPSHPFAPLHR